jgi:hypothetical protein
MKTDSLDTIHDVLTQVADALGEELISQVVFLGGLSVPLLITDERAPRPRPTNDIDLIVSISPKTKYPVFQESYIDLGGKDTGAQKRRLLARMQRLAGLP